MKTRPATAEPIPHSPSTVAPVWQRLDGVAARVIARPPPEEVR